MILGTGQLSDTDRIAPKHLGRNPGWIIAGTENNDIGARQSAQQAFEISVCRNQDKVAAEAYSRILRSPAPASPFRSALSDSGKRSRNNSTSLGERLSSKRSFIL